MWRDHAHPALRDFDRICNSIDLFDIGIAMLQRNIGGCTSESAAASRFQPAEIAIKVLPGGMSPGPRPAQQHAKPPAKENKWA